MNSETRQCQNCKNDFKITEDDLNFYEKMSGVAGAQIPQPKLCAYCRQVRRMLYRNFKTLYKRPCGSSGKSIISMYAPDSPYTVYESSIWWGDSWEGTSYGMDVDLDKSFLQQVNELFKKVPRQALSHVNCTNCDYLNMAFSSKNCYLVFGCVDNEDCSYGHIVWNCRDSFDNLYIFKSESCYECVDCLSCNLLFYSQECESCADSIGLFDCRSCTDCIGCVGLIGKSYYVFNEKVTKEEYKRIKSELSFSDPVKINEMLVKIDDLRKDLPQRSFFGSHNNNVSGNHVYNAHNIHGGFDIKSGEDSKYVYTVRSAIDTYDASFSVTLDNCYEVLNCVGKNILFSHMCIDSHDCMYSDLCYNSSDLLGCFGLRNKSYCILNKQYEKEEYFVLRDKIIKKMIEGGEFGEFFPIWMSPFAYNESIANEYNPLTKGRALEMNFLWKDDIPMTVGQGTMEFEALPESPLKYSVDLAKEIFTCVECAKNYRLTSDEISFYKRMNISIPHKCFNCRHQKRMNLRLPRKLSDGICAHCGESIKTAYSKDQQLQYKLYCEKCYQSEVV